MVLKRGQRVPSPQPASLCASSSCRENVLVLDIFFEALNYEAVEQKAAYEVSELLGVYRVPGSARCRHGRWS